MSPVLPKPRTPLGEYRAEFRCRKYTDKLAALTGDPDIALGYCGDCDCTLCCHTLDCFCAGCESSINVLCVETCHQCRVEICHHCDYEDDYCSDECANAGKVREGLAW